MVLKASSFLYSNVSQQNDILWQRKYVVCTYIDIIYIKEVFLLRLRNAHFLFEQHQKINK